MPIRPKSSLGRRHVRPGHDDVPNGCGLRPELSWTQGSQHKQQWWRLRRDLKMWKRDSKIRKQCNTTQKGSMNRVNRSITKKRKCYYGKREIREIEAANLLGVALAKSLASPPPIVLSKNPETDLSLGSFISTECSCIWIAAGCTWTNLAPLGPDRPAETGEDVVSTLGWMTVNVWM